MVGGGGVRGRARPPVRQFAPSLLSTGRIADEFESHVGDGPFEREVYGMLRLSAALACAVQGDHGGAEAQAPRPRSSRNRSVTSRSVRAVRPGQRRRVAYRPGCRGGERGGRADPGGSCRVACSRVGEPRAALRLERARALSMLGRDTDAIGELRAAERLSPAQIRFNPLVRDMVVSMLDRAGGRDLRGLAWRMGVIRSA